MIDSVIEYAIKVWASDIHISQWKKIVFRIEWDIKILEKSPILDEIKIKTILLYLLKDDKNKMRSFLDNKDIDFAYLHKWINPFRVNAFFKLWCISFVMRKIAEEARDIHSLWLPPWVEKFSKAKQWLILITWPTWAWKSTTLVSILDKINNERMEHIITIEDPIEFVFKDKKSIFSQREVWSDTKSFTVALRSAMREDPNIIMVWELRDKETVESAVELAETGHLVFSTLHTSWSVQSITRLVSFFEPNIQAQVMKRLWDNLFWVLSQRLIKKADRNWRIWIFELMFCNSAIRNIIRSWDLTQLQSSIETWRQDWMIDMMSYAKHLNNKWIILEDDYINYFKDDIDMNSD